MEEFMTGRRSENRRIRELLNRIERFFKRKPDAPEDPYAYVMAPKKPRPPYRGAAAVAEWPEE
jgi:hypothetical protein